MKHLLSGVLVLASAVCWGQSEFTIPLAKANSTLALPSMAARDGVLYAAYPVSYTHLKAGSSLMRSRTGRDSRRLLRTPMILWGG